MKWVLKYYTNLEPLCRRLQTLVYYDKHVNQPWAIVNQEVDRNEDDGVQQIDSDDEHEMGSQDVGMHSQESNSDEEDEVDSQQVDSIKEDDGQDIDSNDEDEMDDQDVNSKEEANEVEGETSYQELNSDEDEMNSQEISSDEEDEVEANSDEEDEVQEFHEWNSDDDGILDIDKSKWRREWGGEAMNILGFHPYKDVIFLGQEYEVIAYHLMSSKAQYLGNTCPKGKYFSSPAYLYESYVYTPCLIDSLPKNSN
ncbi:unnamed protein product [Urochloa decumbens]|uniref:Uncharacterized protein n=1 Tax=Urochloa decumbens TaxID=240449 RepID=A0ABC9D8L3_9POAL